MTKARVIVMVIMIMVKTMFVEGNTLPLSEEKGDDCLVEDSVEVVGQNLSVSLLAYVSSSISLDMGYFFPSLNRKDDRDAVSINSTGVTHTEVRGGNGNLTAIPVLCPIPMGWNTFLVDASNRSVTVTLMHGEDRCTLITLPSLRSEVHAILAKGKVARCPTVTPTWKVLPDERAEVVLQPAWGSAPNQWLEVDGGGWGAAAPYLDFRFSSNSKIVVRENSTFRIASNVRDDHVHYRVFKEAKSGGGGDGDEEVTSGNVTVDTLSLRVVVDGGHGGDDDSTNTTTTITLVHLQLLPPRTKSMDNSVSSSSDYFVLFLVLVVVLVLVLFVLWVLWRCLLARRERRRNTRHDEAEGQEGNSSLHMNGTFRGVGSEEGVNGGGPSCDHPLLPYTNGTPMQRGTTRTGDTSNDRCERSKKHGVKRTIQDFLSRPYDSDSFAGKHNISERCIANGKSIVLSCEGTQPNESSETDKAVSAELQNLCSSILSKTQLDAILNKRGDSHWPGEDVSAAFTLNEEEEEEEEGEDERAKNSACELGILCSVLFIMKSIFDSFTQLERLDVISLDEMPINSERSYDKGNDTLYRPHEKVQTVMLSELLGKWEQSVFYDLDVTDMSKTLMTLREEAEHAGYPVVAPVHDLGLSNVKMWEELGTDPVGTEKISFRNWDIYMFDDVPQLVQIINNNFIDSCFYLENCTIISDSCIRKMLTATNTEYALAFNVSEMHLNESGFGSVEYPEDRKLLIRQYIREAADFLGMTDGWFDEINSSGMFGDKQSCNAFRVYLRDQINFLHRMTETIRTMRVENPQYNKGLDMFQRGMILSSHSLIGLYDMLRESFNVEYILTRNLNQDGWNIYLGAYNKCMDPMTT